jgi:hypothetical protein
MGFIRDLIEDDVLERRERDDEDDIVEDDILAQRERDEEEDIVQEEEYDNERAEIDDEERLRALREREWIDREDY